MLKKAPGEDAVGLKPEALLVVVFVTLSFAFRRQLRTPVGDEELSPYRLQS